jgi:hypothetical protein
MKHLSSIEFLETRIAPAAVGIRPASFDQSGTTATDDPFPSDALLPADGSSSSTANAPLAAPDTTAILSDGPLLRIEDTSVQEGHFGRSEMTFTVSLSGASELPISVSYRTHGGSAEAGVDYARVVPATLEFAPGETTKLVTVTVFADTQAERNETFTLALSRATNALIDVATAAGTILNDDVTITDPRTATFSTGFDTVKIKVSKGVLKAKYFTLLASDIGPQLALIDFSGREEFSGANLSINATSRFHGIAEAVANVGYINATGIDLGRVKVDGDLGRIDVGSESKPGAALLELSVGSIGLSGSSNQLPGGSSLSNITGALNEVRARQFWDAKFLVSGGIGSLRLGSLIESEIRCDGRIGALKIVESPLGLQDSIITARGRLNPATDGEAIAIGSLDISGTVSGTQILAGYDRKGAAVNAGVSIGSVSVDGDWVASSLVAGVTAGEDNDFGTEDDAPIPKIKNTPLVSRIASIVISGEVAGTESEGDYFGFVAKQIDAFQSAGTNLALASGPGNDLVGLTIGSTRDVTLREIA